MVAVQNGTGDNVTATKCACVGSNGWHKNDDESRCCKCHSSLFRFGRGEGGVEFRREGTNEVLGLGGGGGSGMGRDRFPRLDSHPTPQAGLLGYAWVMLPFG